jgi:hypothetical protein
MPSIRLAVHLAAAFAILASPFAVPAGHTQETGAQLPATPSSRTPLQSESVASAPVPQNGALLAASFGDPWTCGRNALRARQAVHVEVAPREALQQLHATTPRSCAGTRAYIYSAMSTAPASYDERLWRLSNEAGTCHDYNNYLTLHPNGMFRREALEGRTRTCPSGQRTTSSPGAG